MSTNRRGAIELPAQPKDKEFEEYIAGYVQCAGLYIERNIVERDVKEVLELDIITTNYDQCPPDMRLVEIKSGGWGFSDIFKLYGWLKYLEIERGALVVQEPKETPKAQRFYAEKTKALNIDLAAADPGTNTAAALADLLNEKEVDETDLSLWRFSYWMERNLVKRLTSRKKTVPAAKRFRAMDDYLFAVNSGVFFTQGAVNRAQALYDAFRKDPHISAKCAHEELGRDFDDGVDVIDMRKFQETFYDCSYTDIQISTYIEHRARLMILKSAIDHLLYSQAGHMSKAGEKVLKFGRLNIANAPESFLNGLEQIATHKHFHRNPVFWQWFFWLFGGFILKDYEQQDYEALSARTGIPVEEIPLAMSSYGVLFPLPGGWFSEPNSNVRVMKMFPVPFMGVGANLRKDLYTENGEFEELKLTGQWTHNDLKRWNNLAVEVLREERIR